MKSKEELIDEIERRSRELYKKCSISDLEKMLDGIENSLKKIEYVEKIIKKVSNDIGVE